MNESLLLKRALSTLGALLAAGLVVGASSPARAEWKCCDQWGYDYPGFYFWQSSCEDAGGVVYNNTLTCPNDMLFFKCCDASGAPIPGIYGSEHDCKVAGHEVFSGLICPNTQPFQCCDPDGGSAPGIYLYQSSCIADGYVVQDFSLSGCDGGWQDQAQSWWNDNRISIRCPKRLKAHYSDDNDPDTDGVQSVIGDWASDYNDAIPDNTEICANVVDDDDDGSTDELDCQSNWSDKDTHCVLSCLLTVECGERSARLAGWARETMQMCDDALGNAWGTGDECANDFGRDYGVTLPYTTAAEAEADCRNHCNGIADLEQTCGPNEIALFFLSLGLAGAEALMPETIAGLNNPLSSLWTNFITNCGDGLFPLSYPTTLPETIAALKAQGQALIASAQGTGLAVGQSGTFPGGALMHRLDTDHYALFIHVPAEEVDAHLEYVGGVLQTLQLRGASEHLISMTMADPIVTACSNPPCEKRVAWMQWAIEREPVPTLIPSTP